MKATIAAAIRDSPPALSLCTNFSKGLNKRFIVVLLCMLRYYIIETPKNGQASLKSHDFGPHAPLLYAEKREGVAWLPTLIRRAAGVEQQEAVFVLKERDVRVSEDSTRASGKRILRRLRRPSLRPESWIMDILAPPNSNSCVSGRFASGGS
ncbi:MAG: hypothetical protein M3122_06515, partial [Actinomycetota bacterium]|nr:hypothetical protein [Actinomycetota bacterium]